ncbi:MAG: cobalt-precorrin-5B (C(1))-methyltransferase [Deltaproteobacteria bacterium]|nr:cobalt-precorrin-5B (C(1))-methyltransferase [Deltaproteobacteria bacterium]
MKHGLRHGYTTGACAAAAAKGAALMLARQETLTEVAIDLPAGISATFELHGQEFGPESASCFVVKDAGDDPDVTNGAEVHARVTANPPSPPFLKGGDIIIEGGAGIGKVTKPGLAVPPGEWAINPVPRRMIEQSILSVFPKPKTQNSKLKIDVIISIPDGEERAKKTLNARLGIVGGLSILGTSGIVRPISAKAWTDTIEAALDVARACGSPTVLLSTGRTSELAAQRFIMNRESGFGNRDSESVTAFSASRPFPLPGLSRFPLPGLGEEAFVMMGDHVAYALRACADRGFDRPIIACQFAKLLKIACGYENTHAAASELDLATLRQWAEEERLAPRIIAIIDRANTAREIIIASGFDEQLLELVRRRAHAAAIRFAPSLRVEFLVADYAGKIVSCSR